MNTTNSLAAQLADDYGHLHHQPRCGVRCSRMLGGWTTDRILEEAGVLTRTHPCESGMLQHPDRTKIILRRMSNDSLNPAIRKTLSHECPYKLSSVSPTLVRRNDRVSDFKHAIGIRRTKVSPRSHKRPTSFLIRTKESIPTIPPSSVRIFVQSIPEECDCSSVVLAWWPPFGDVCSKKSPKLIGRIEFH